MAGDVCPATSSGAGDWPRKVCHCWATAVHRQRHPTAGTAVASTRPGRGGSCARHSAAQARGSRPGCPKKEGEDGIQWARHGYSGDSHSEPPGHDQCGKFLRPDLGQRPGLGVRQPVATVHCGARWHRHLLGDHHRARQLLPGSTSCSAAMPRSPVAATTTTPTTRWTAPGTPSLADHLAVGWPAGIGPASLPQIPA